MDGESTTPLRAACDVCGFQAPDGSDEWDVADHPPLGRITRCPDCGSTNVYSRG